MTIIGATICTPTSPKCSICPIQTVCKAYPTSMSTSPDIEDLTVLLPTKSPKKAPKEVNVFITVLRAEDSYLMWRRADSGLLAGQWEFPSIAIPARQETGNDEGNELNEDEAWDRCIQQVQSKTGFTNLSTISDIERLPESIIHVFSHERHTMTVQLYCLPSKCPSLSEGVVWRSEKEILEGGLTTGVKKVFHAVTKVLERKNVSILKREDVFSVMMKSSSSEKADKTKIKKATNETTTKTDSKTAKSVSIAESVSKSNSNNKTKKSLEVVLIADTDDEAEISGTTKRIKR